MMPLAILALKLAVAAFMATKLVVLAMAGVFCGALARALAHTRFGQRLRQRASPGVYPERRRRSLRQRAYAAENVGAGVDDKISCLPHRKPASDQAFRAGMKVFQAGMKPAPTSRKLP